jgi:protein-glutamine gamma-glutamyltransferase
VAASAQLSKSLRPSGRVGWGAAAWSPLVWTSLALGGGVLLHADRVPFWVTGIAFALLAWRAAAAAGITKLPGKLPRALIAFALVGGVFARFHTLNGLNPGTALLVMMAAVKLLETFTRRDQYIVLGGSLFLLLAACLERQDLPRAPLYLLEIWLCCAAFGSVAYSASASSAAPLSVAFVAVPRFDNRAAVLLAGRALLYAIPLALVLFVFFPRIPGAFWSLPRSEEAETGLSDTMSPGSISQLTSSYEIAFRVKFDGALPPPQQRYWRGPVLHEFDGYTWKRRPDTRYLPQHLEYSGTAYH